MMRPAMAMSMWNMEKFQTAAVAIDAADEDLLEEEREGIPLAESDTTKRDGRDPPRPNFMGPQQ